jgi:glucose dehydrogenase
VGGDLGDKHYSALAQINLQNVQSLGGAWVSAPFDDGASSRSTPAMKDGRLFFNAGSRVYALDAKTGAVIWKFKNERASDCRTLKVSASVKALSS